MSKNNSSHNLSHYDIAIIGGGMAGSSMALLLAKNVLSKKQQAKKGSAQADLKIAVIEKNSYQKTEQASFDDRCIALSWSSKKIFQKMGIWSLLENSSSTEESSEVLAEILDIHVSDRGKMGIARLNHLQENVSALGYVAESRALGEVLTQQVSEQKNISLYCPAQLKQLQHNGEQATLELEYRKKTVQLTASLVIAADGANSFGHTFLEQAPQVDAYQQTAIIANVETQFPHKNIAYERFTPSGPLAMLPLTNGRCSLVWTVREEQVASVLGLSDDDFLAQLQQQFSYRLGKITRTGKRFAYPLALMKLDPEAAKKCPGIAFVGNAAHSIHPVAGQGFNLGLRDIAVLADLIEKNRQNNKGQFVFEQSLIEQYWVLREPDIKTVGKITNNLIKIFSNDQFPWTPSRDFGLILADTIMPLKHKIARQAMGMGIIAIEN